jgi:hypothetical protein
MKVKPFIEEGHYSRVYDPIFDYVMPILTDREWKVFCYIFRCTKGWQKECAEITYRKFLAGTGIRSYTTLQKALDGLEAKGLIIAHRGKIQSQATTYEFNTHVELEITTFATKNVARRGFLATEDVMSNAIESVATAATKPVAHIISNNNHNDKHAASQHARNKNSNSDQNSQEKHSDGWQLIYRAVMEACGITDNQIQASGKLQKDVADVVRWALKECSDKEPLQIAKRIKAFGIWWSHRENKEGQKFGLPTPSTIIRYWSNFVKWCKDNLDGYLPTEKTFTFVGIKA